MLLIDNDAQRDLLTMDVCIDTLEAAFTALPQGRAVIRPKTDVYFPSAGEAGYFRFGSMEGAFDGIFAIRMTSDICQWDEVDGVMREEEYCIEPGTYCGLVLLFSSGTGAPLALLNDGFIQTMRVGGSAGLGAKYLAREDARSVGVIGAGGMARTCLEAFCQVRPIERATVYSPTKTNRERFAEEMSAKLGIAVTAEATARAAMAGADIVATCTNSMTPVIENDWIEPGMHMVPVGTQEIPPAAAARFDVRIRQGVAAIEPRGDDSNHRAEIGLSYSAFVGGTEQDRKRLPRPNPAARLDAAGYPSFADLVTGATPGRTSPDQVTFYYNHGNQGLQFASVGGAIYRAALERGSGQALPDAWFLQDIKA